MDDFRSGFVAVIGRPNVGKSTLLNALIGQKVSIVSDKPQTTRNTIQCVYTTEDAQIVFLDTPGIHKPHHRLGEYMVKSAREALEQVDVIVLLTELTRWTKEDEDILSLLQGISTPVLLVGNKVDLVEEKDIKAFFSKAADKLDFAQYIAISAQQQLGLEELVTELISFLPAGPKYYPDDWITDHPERFVIAEFVREQVLIHTEQEIPHSVAVDVDEIKEDERKNLVRIRATIYVERDSQKGIVIGKQGQMLKSIGSDARGQIESLLGSKVFLDLWVKVKKDWRSKPGALREFGYQ